MIACDVANGRVWRVPPGGDRAPYGDRVAFPNYPVLDADSVLWVCGSGGCDHADGGVVRITPDGSTQQLAVRGLRFANGMALRDGRPYLIESQGPSIVRLELSDAGDPQQVVVLPGTVPDGLAFDAEGGLWIFCYQPNRVYSVSPDGELDLVAGDWSGWHHSMPTNRAFAGPALDQLVLANLGGRHQSTFRPGVRGVPLERPVLA